MKWLLLLVLISCGKHQSPQAVDMMDSDGDLNPNATEPESERYIANFETLGLIKGTVSFVADQSHVLEFSNSSNLDADAMRLLVGKTSLENGDQYFSEWTQLKINSTDSVDGIKDVTKLIINFNLTATEPDEIVLIQNKTIKSLGKWEPTLRLDIPKIELVSLLSHKAVLAVRKKFKTDNFYSNDPELTIKNKTLRVYVNDGSKSKVSYVSKELSFRALLDIFKISSPTQIIEDELFFNTKEKSEVRWFYRKYSNGDLVFVKTKIQEVKKNFLANFNYKKIDLRRENGLPVNTLELENRLNVRIFFKVRPLRTMRTFVETSNTEKFKIGNAYRDSDQQWTCTYYNREISSEVASFPTYHDFINNLNFFDSALISAKMLEDIDEKGPYWEVMMVASQANIKLDILPRPTATFTTTGQYHNQCTENRSSRPGPSYQTNDEGKLSFEIESYVEKADQKLYN